MDTISAFESYVLAVQLGSISGAARQRQISQPALSQQISALEALYEARLLSRSRKGVRMTPSGELLYKHAVAILDEQASLKSGLKNLSAKVAGKLVVTANLGFSQHIMGDVIINLAKKFPNLKIDLRADDRILHLEAEKIDIALRSGRVGEGDGVVRKIATSSVLHVATPEYLDKAGRPQTPDELVNLNYIQYRVDDDQIATTLSKAGQIIQAPIKIGLTAQLPDLIFQAIYANFGYAKIPEFLVRDAIDKGRLEVVLPDWKIPEKELYIVFPARERPSLRVLAFLKEVFKQLDKSAGIKMVVSARHMLQAP